jgi:hypothetical protein
MLLGLLYKAKEETAIAVQHLTEARRILAQFGNDSVRCHSIAPLRATEESIAHFARKRHRRCFDQAQHAYDVAHLREKPIVKLPHTLWSIVSSPSDH